VDEQRVGEQLGQQGQGMPVPLAQVGLGLAAEAAEHPVDVAMPASDRRADVRADPLLGRHPQRRRDRVVARVADHWRQPAVDHPPTVGVRQRGGDPQLQVEPVQVALDGLQYLGVDQDPGIERDLHPEMAPRK